MWQTLEPSWDAPDLYAVEAMQEPLEILQGHWGLALTDGISLTPHGVLHLLLAHDYSAYSDISVQDHSCIVSHKLTKAAKHAVNY